MKKLFYFLIALIVIIAGLYLVNGFTYSSGVRSGKLVKLSKRGILIHTYEGTLDLGSGDQLTWNFSVRNHEVAEKMLKDIGQYVELSYKERLLKLFYKTKYDVVDWKISKRKDLQGLAGSSSEAFCLFVKELNIDPELSQSIKSFLEDRQSIFTQKYNECLK